MLPIFANLIYNNENDNRRRVDLIRERRLLRERSNVFNIPDARFIELFRLNKIASQNLIQVIRPHLLQRQRHHAISIDIKVLTALRFYATGCYQRSVGQDFNLGLSQTSVHR